MKIKHMVLNLRHDKNLSCQKIYSHSRITIVTQARETPSFLDKAALLPIFGLLTIFWYFKARSYLEMRFFNFLVLILWRRWPSRRGNSVVKKFEFRTDEGANNGLVFARPLLFSIPVIPYKL